MTIQPWELKSAAVRPAAQKGKLDFPKAFLEGTIRTFSCSVEQIPRGWADGVRAAGFTKVRPRASKKENHFGLKATASHAEVASVAPFRAFGSNMFLPPTIAAGGTIFRL